MKASEQYFLVVLFIMLYKVALTWSLWMKSYSVAMKLKTLRQDFYTLSFIWDL